MVSEALSETHMAEPDVFAHLPKAWYMLTFSYSGKKGL